VAAATLSGAAGATLSGATGAKLRGETGSTADAGAATMETAPGRSRDPAARPNRMDLTCCVSLD
jgi:hypothetical protein